MADGIDDVAVVIVMEWESCCSCCVFGYRGVAVQRKPVEAGQRDNGAAGCYCCCQLPSCLHSNLLLTNFLPTSHHWILRSFISQESTSKCQAASNLEKWRGSAPLVSRQIAFGRLLRHVFWTTPAMAYTFRTTLVVHRPLATRNGCVYTYWTKMALY